MKNKKLVRSIRNTFIKIDNGEFVQIVQMPDLESLLDGQIEWPDSVDPFTEYYNDGSRTNACSGCVIE